MRRAQTEDSGRGQGNVQSEQEQERDRCGRFTGDGGAGEAGGGHVVRDSSHHQELILDARRNL